MVTEKTGEGLSSVSVLTLGLRTGFIEKGLADLRPRNPDRFEIDALLND